MKKATATKEYLELCEKYKNIYGEKTVVLGQIGAFYEVYGLQDKKKNILPLALDKRKIAAIIFIKIIIFFLYQLQLHLYI